MYPKTINKNPFQTYLIPRVDPQLSSKIEHMLHSSAELWANPGLDKFGNDFHWWFLGTFCLLKEFLKKKNFKKKFKISESYEYEMKMKKKILNLIPDIKMYP